MGDGILRQHSGTIGIDQLWNAVVDFGIDMVRPACEHDAEPARVFQPGQRFFSLFARVVARCSQLGPGRSCGVPDLKLRQAVFFRKELDQPVCHNGFALEREERILIDNAVCTQLLDIIFNIFSVGGNDRAVIMISCPCDLRALVRYARIRNIFYTLGEQPHNMPVRKLGRIAFRLARNRLDAELVDLPRGKRGEHDAIAQSGEKGIPERVIFIHVEHARDADRAPGCNLLCERLVIEIAVQLVLEQIWDIVLVFLLSDAALAAVARHILPAAGKFVDGQKTAVCAAFAASHCGFEAQFGNLSDGQHGRRFAGIVLPRNQRRAERAHNARNIRANRVASENGLEAS